MATRGTGPAGGAPRGTARHVPVLLPQMVQALAPNDGGSFIDGTFGAGGYSEAILAARIAASFGFCTTAFMSAASCPS